MEPDRIDAIAFDIVQDYLSEGPEYLAISETVEDEGGDAHDTEKVALVVRLTLNGLGGTFNIQ